MSPDGVSQAGDQADFAALVEPYRRELQVLLPDDGLLRAPMASHGPTHDDKEGGWQWQGSWWPSSSPSTG
jgi:hypothetical protein